MDGYGGVQYYQDDGLGGLGGDDGLGGLGGYAPPQQPMYGDDGLMYMPMDEPEPAAEPQKEQQEELEELLDVGLFGTEPSQAPSQQDSLQLPSRSQHTGDEDEDDEATEDEQEFDDFEDGQEQQVAAEEQQQQEVQPEVLDPTALEAQRQNAWYK